MSNNRHKNSARNQLRATWKLNAFGKPESVTVEAKWFANRRKRNRVRDRTCTDAPSVHARYAELMERNALREAA